MSEAPAARAAAAAPASAEAAASLRLDKWLFHARFAKSRGIVARLVTESGVRVNGTRAAKPAQPVRPDDVLTFALGGRVRVVQILALGVRRGPAPEARALYDDLSPPPPERPVSPAPRAPGAGRPEKAERRALERLRGRDD